MDQDDTIYIYIYIYIYTPILTAHMVYFSAVGEQWRNCGSVVNRARGVFSSPKHLGQVWGPPNFLCNR